MNDQFHSAIEVIESREMRMSEWSKTRIKTEVEIKEEFCAVPHSIKSEEERTVDNKTAILPEIHEIQRSENSSKFSELIWYSNDDISSSVRCRLCANPNNAMVDIFSTNQMEGDILKKIKYSLPIVVRESDSLPKQVCRCCLAKLELCYEFQRTVAEAERELLAFDRLVSGKLEGTESDCPTSSLCDGQHGATENDCIEKTLRVCSDVEMKYESTTIPEERRTTNIKDSAPVHNKKKCYKCNTCAKTFTNKYYMARHNKRHTDERLRSCKYCEKKFTYPSDRDRHQSIHTNQRPYECTICGRRFIQLQGLTRHAAVHSENRDYHCPLCNKSFKLLETRKRHVLVHTNERPWQCDHCKNSFKRRRDLQMHLKTCKEYLKPK